MKMRTHIACFSIVSKIIYITFGLLLFLVSDLRAQKEVTNQSLYWIRYYNLLQIDKHFTWHNEAEMRRFWERDVLHHFIVHTRMHYALERKTNVAFGLTYSRQSPQNPNSISRLVVPELRGVQEINYNISVIDRLTLQQRLRIEERFIRRNNGMELLSGYNFNFRFRLRLQANYRLSPNSKASKTILKLSNEVMFNVGKNIVFNQFDQNRIYLGVEKDISKVLSAEIGYLKWYQQTAAGNTFFNRDIIRFTLYHRMKWKKSKSKT